jgi:hypothetical protein
MQLRSLVDFWSSEARRRIDGISGLMVSFAEMTQRTSLREASEKAGLKPLLRFAGSVYLDNGSFSLMRDGKPIDEAGYMTFVARSKPDWYPVPADYIPTPNTPRASARRMAERTAKMNARFGPLGCVPVVHVGPYFLDHIHRAVRQLKPRRLAIGGFVPYLRWANRSTLRSAIEAVVSARKAYDGELHIFGLGGGITALHLAAALRADSVDSSGWRVRAAKGIILLPGSGQHLVTANSGRSAGPQSPRIRAEIARCECGVCELGEKALRASRGRGFENRAIHNIWVLAQECMLLNQQGTVRNLATWSRSRLQGHPRQAVIEHARRAMMVRRGFA